MLLGIGLSVVPMAGADQVWDITGSFVLVENNACGGLCAESVSYSFDLKYVPLFPGQQTGQYQGEVGDFTAVGLGSLGSFSVSYPAFYSIANTADGGFAGFDVLGEGPTEIDIQIPNILNSPTPNGPTPTPLGPDFYLKPTLYSCGTRTCINDLDFPNRIFLDGKGSYYSLLLAIGLSVLVIWRRCATEKSWWVILRP